MQSTSFAELIKKFKKLKHLTQKDFGRLLNPPVAQTTVGRWKEGKCLTENIFLTYVARSR
jgi:transcriptional regulator with XRE-family HTH domain